MEIVTKFGAPVHRPELLIPEIVRFLTDEMDVSPGTVAAVLQLTLCGLIATLPERAAEQVAERIAASFVADVMTAASEHRRGVH